MIKDHGALLASDVLQLFEYYAFSMRLSQILLRGSHVVVPLIYVLLPIFGTRYACHQNLTFSNPNVAIPNLQVRSLFPLTDDVQESSVHMFSQVAGL